MNPFTTPTPPADPFGKKTDRRGFLARILAGAVAAPAVTKIIKNGIRPAPTVNPPPPAWPTPYSQISQAFAYTGSTILPWPSSATCYTYTYRNHSTHS